MAQLDKPLKKPPSKRIGKYELGKTLGVGNFSKVKLGTDVETGDNWAIKIIDKEQLAKEHMEEQLKREIAVMKLLKHENIVQLREVMQTANHIYLVLELVTGGELFDRIVAAKKFDEATARKYFHQLILGVHYCHQQGIAHRDIKPENLLLDGHDVLKISDFGLSNIQRGGPTRQSLLTTVCGTPNYVAPEVLKEKGYNGLIADIWSCGVVLFVMLAGYLPFDDQNMNALFNKIERGDFKMARHFTDLTKDLISKMITVDPEKRITINEIVQHPWFQVGFNAQKLSSATQKVAVTAEQVDNAIRTEVEMKHEKDKLPVPTATSRGCDAFDLISRLTSGTLNPLISMNHGTAIIQSTTRFLLKGEPKDLINALESLKGSPKCKDNGLEVKGFFTGQMEKLITYLAIVIPTCAPGLHLVEFRRGRGNAHDFHMIYRQLLAALGQKVHSTEKELPT